MKPIDVYKIWAPHKSIWSPWVRPVPFLDIEGVTGLFAGQMPQVNYCDYIEDDTALFIDLEGTQSVLHGLACAIKGFQPVALFNATPPQENARALVDTKSITNLLYWGTSILKDLYIAPQASPVFLLDSTRLLRHKASISVYDNSWDLYDQDIPSAEYFMNHGIKKIVIIADKINRDLGKIFYKFQRKGIGIYVSDGFSKPKLVTVKKPPKKDKFH
jgi:hypothetical protein